ncbi:MAG: hypothetical protein H7276_01340 [Caulobacter sp.]|nr:hypothetical protein [Vitreoscilla sp.]
MVVVVHPLGAQRVLHHLLAEAVVLEQRRLHALAQVGHGQLGLDEPDPDDHHQVGLGIHAQPGGIHPRHAFDVCAQAVAVTL